MRAVRALTRALDGHNSTTRESGTLAFAQCTEITSLLGMPLNQRPFRPLSFLSSAFHPFLRRRQDKLTESIITYVRYQADCGADVVQIFDSWGCNLHPSDWDVFSGPYIKRIVEGVKATHPNLPLILYASGSGGMLVRAARLLSPQALFLLAPFEEETEIAIRGATDIVPTLQHSDASL